MSGNIGSRPVQMRSGNIVLAGLSRAHGKPEIRGFVTSSFARTTMPVPQLMPISVGSPLLGHNNGDPTLIGMSWGTGIVVLANDDVTKPLISGFPWALDKPANTMFPLRICTGRDPMFPDMLPY